MKITYIRMETYRWKREKPIRNGMYVYPTAGLNVVKVETDEGATGVGPFVEKCLDLREDEPYSFHEREFLLGLFIVPNWIRIS